ncbi:DUF2637 domain-containing protein [Streptomyces sp. NPDC059499]|uniref:DUF2637 domain-containing protein n=1 Tax=Streptomyces sp. NPDC059499 TaxID=3346852 RepID=UPI003687CFCF
MSSRPDLTRLQRRLIGVVITLTIGLAGIGFAGSYTAVRALAVEQKFGRFALVFPIGLDAGIVVLLALDLLLAWCRMPFPLLRQTAWLLTAGTIWFNASVAWPDPVGTGMHAVLPILFVISVEAGRHAVGRIADITADRDMDTVRLSRWLLSPIPTFRLWRRMKLWELRSYTRVIELEQDRLIYQAQLQARYGRGWRRKAPVRLRLQLRLARYGRPLDAPVAQLVAAVPATDDGFELAAAQAVALAPPTAVAALEAAPLQPSPQQAATPAITPAAAPATPATPPVPTNTVPPGVAQLPVICRPQRHTRHTATPPPAATPAAPSRPAVQHPATPVVAAIEGAAARATATAAAGCNTAAPMTVADVAAQLGVTRGTVRSWVSRGKLTPLPRTGRNARNAPHTFDPAAVAALDAPPATPSQPDRMEGGYA